MILVGEEQGEALHAAVTARQEQRQIRGQPAQRKQQRQTRLHLVIELDLGVETVRGFVANEGRRSMAAQRV